MVCQAQPGDRQGGRLGEAYDGRRCAECEEEEHLLRSRHSCRLNNICDREREGKRGEGGTEFPGALQREWIYRHCPRPRRVRYADDVKFHRGCSGKRSPCRLRGRQLYKRLVSEVCW